MDLKDMSLDKLWELFPIIFVNYSDKYEKIYSDEEKTLTSLLKSYIKRINHIGSTAIKNIKTKPIVDILVEIDFANKSEVKNVLLKNGYILMCENFEKMSFNKGYTINGYSDKVFHIHIKNFANCDELYFRDYLNENYFLAKEYEKLKLDLYNKYAPDRNLYTEGKKNFVENIVKLSKEKYKNKY